MDGWGARPLRWLSVLVSFAALFLSHPAECHSWQHYSTDVQLSSMCNKIVIFGRVEIGGDVIPLAALLSMPFGSCAWKKLQNLECRFPNVNVWMTVGDDFVKTCWFIVDIVALSLFVSLDPGISVVVRVKSGLERLSARNTFSVQKATRTLWEGSAHSSRR